ncbi:MAG TPA: class I SAM-dependent methyltransferase [Bacteroidales bacterium]|nr:class I SAM-dependent methyltransferase [Bacteroidales bacterium]
MKINTNAWNRFRYTLYAPFYDFFACFYNDSRKNSIESLEIKPGDKILIVGAGTGLDLKFLPSGCEIYATDITPTVVRRIARRNKKLNLNLQAIVMDGQALEFTDNTFEKIILHLILAVIPDPVACLKESERVLKPGGQIVVYDKFVPKGKKVSLLRWLLNLFAKVLFTDLTRDFESIVKQTTLKVISDKDADFNGNFRLIKLIKM